MRTRAAGRHLARTVLALSLAGSGAVALGTGCGSDEGLVGGSCASGYVQCGDRCVDLETDPNDCGGCGQACLAGVTCTSGVCGGSAADASTDGASDGTADGAGTANPADGTTTEGSSPGDAANGSDGSNDTAMDGSGASEGSDASGTNDGSGGGGASNDATSPDGAGANSDGGSTDASDGGAAKGDGAGNDAGDGGGGTNTDATTSDDGAPPNDATGGGSSNGDSGGTAGDATSSGDDAPSGEQGGNDAETADSSAGVGADDGDDSEPPVCTAPFIPCGGTCVDPTSDPSNCGTCRAVCPSQICQNSQCIGAPSGGLIFIGNDYESATPGSQQAHVLSNAVFIPQTNPLRVLIYERYASSSAITQVGNILNSVGLGRTLQTTPTVDDTEIPRMLSLQNYDVLLVLDQPTAPAGALAMIGPASGGNWAPTLAAFAQSGGVIVVLDGGTGTAEMPEFVTGTGLLNITAQSVVAPGTELDDVARGDVVSVGLLSAYRPGGNSVSVTTEANNGDVVYVIVTSPDAGTSAPVVIHKVF